MRFPILLAALKRKLPLAVWYFAAQVAIALDGHYLVQAIEDGDIEGVRTALMAGVSPNYIEEGYGSALQIATESEQHAIVELLISAGADSSGTSDSDDRTPLHIAVDTGNEEILEYLLASGVLVDKADERGQSAMFVAIQNNDISALNKLLSHGANINVQDKSGLTPLVATIVSKPRIAEILLANGAEIDAAKIARMTLCGNCHGPTGLGHPVNKIFPYLAGQNREYLLKQILDYREKRRTFAAMSRYVAGMNDDVAEAVAAYYSKQDWSSMQERSPPRNTEEGARLYVSGAPSCASCHGGDGISTINQRTPMLAGMNSQYVAVQLKNFRAGYRVNDPDRAMRAAASDLTDEQISHLSEYVESLR